MPYPAAATRRRYLRTALTSAAALAIFAIAVGSCTSRPPEIPPPPPEVAARLPTPGKTRNFVATAYSTDGTTKSGSQTRTGIVAADPRVLPIGTRIRVAEAGPYSGVYTVTDTGRAIKGSEIDLFIPDAKEAKRFGRRHVQVEVLGKD
jgi:3D (Asp-Asp-Asp) domain-containing protein